MAAVTGRMIGKELCEALKLDIKGVRTIDLHVAADEVTTITVVRLLQDDEATAMNKVLEKYQLHYVPAETKAEDVTTLTDEFKREGLVA